MAQQVTNLIFAWALFGIFHSLLASTIVKNKLMQLMGKGDIYYRLIYSLVTAVTLVLVLHAHFSCDKIVLWLLPTIEKIAAAIMILGGLVIMVICAYDYLPRVSGISQIMSPEKKPILKKSGLHAYVRHPLYAGTFLFIWGVFLGYPYLNILVSSTCVTIYTLIGIRFEEKKLLETFGDEYREYQKNVPMLLPGMLGRKFKTI